MQPLPTPVSSWTSWSTKSSPPRCLSQSYCSWRVRKSSPARSESWLPKVTQNGVRNSSKILTTGSIAPAKASRRLEAVFTLSPVRTTSRGLAAASAARRTSAERCESFPWSWMSETWKRANEPSASNSKRGGGAAVALAVANAAAATTSAAARRTKGAALPRMTGAASPQMEGGGVAAE